MSVASLGSGAFGAGMRPKWSSPAAKEWSHFCVLTPAGHWVINLATQRDRSGLVGTVSVLCAASGAEIAKSSTWHAEVARHFDDEVSVSPALCTWGASSLRLLPDRQVLTLSTEQCRAELCFAPRCTPYLAHNVGFVRGSSFNWFAAPLCQVDGWFEWRGRRVDLVAASGYSDHNWGDFDWGGDFAWEWGFNACRTADDPCFVFSRVTDGSRLRTYTQGLLVWERGELVRAFREHELTVTRSGTWSKAPSAQAPALLGHLLDVADADVPSQLHIVASARSAQLELSFEARDLAQFVLPDERRVGVCAMNEAFGALRAQGSIAGRSLDLECAANFEFFGRAPAAGASLAGLGGGRECSGAASSFDLRSELGPCCRLLRQALESVERQAPGAYARLCELAFDLDCSLTLTSDAPETARLLGNRAGIRWTSPAGIDAPVEIHVEKCALAELLRGQLRVLDLLRTERMLVRASADWFVRLAEFGTCFLHALTRCRGSEALLGRLLAELGRHSSPRTLALTRG